MIFFTILMGMQIMSLVSIISEWRIAEFKEYPYLYYGNYDYEKSYVKAYTQSEKSSVAVAYDDTKVIGFLTGIPLIEDTETFATTESQFKKHGLDPQLYYYFGEVIILPDYRKHHIATQLFALLEEQAVNLGYKNICFITIEHGTNHPLKPFYYEDTAQIWSKLGYSKTPITIALEYPTIHSDGSVKNAWNTMVYWVKTIV